MRRCSTPLWITLLALITPVAAGEAPEDAALAGETTRQRGNAYYHLMQARLLAGSGRVYNVLEELREAVALEPDSAELKAQSATLLLRIGQTTEAERMASAALELEASNGDAVRVLADLAARDAARSAKSRAEAIRLYELLAEEDPPEDQVLLILAQLKQTAGDREGAIDVARRLVAQRPGDAVSVRLLAQSLVLDARHGEALQVILDHLSRNPDSEELLPTVEELVPDTEDWDAVVPVFRRIVTARPESPVAQRLLGRALLMLGRSAEAVPVLEVASDLDPENPGVRLDLANAYWRSKRLADATVLARRLSEEYPGAIQSRWVLGEALADQGDVAGAIEAFDAALAVASPLTPRERDQLRIRMTDLLLGHDEAGEAQRVVDQLERADGPEAVRLQARIAVARGDLVLSRKLASRLRNLDRAGAAALIEGEALLVQGRRVAAEQTLVSAIELMGREGRLWVDRLLQNHDETEMQERFLRQWVEQDPSNADAHFALGSLLDRQGRHEVAEIQLRRVIEMDPQHAWALNHLGYSLADRNERLEEALALVRRALDVDPWNGAYLDSLGWVYYRMGRYQDALEPMQRAAREYPRDPVVLEHLGDIYERLGRIDAAVLAWRQALANGPDDPGPLQSKLEGRAAGVETPTTETARKSTE